MRHQPKIVYFLVISSLVIAELSDHKPSLFKRSPKSMYSANNVLKKRGIFDMFKNKKNNNNKDNSHNNNLPQQTAKKINEKENSYDDIVGGLINEFDDGEEYIPTPASKTEDDINDTLGLGLTEINNDIVEFDDDFEVIDQESFDPLDFEGFNYETDQDQELSEIDQAQKLLEGDTIQPLSENDNEPEEEYDIYYVDNERIKPNEGKDYEQGYYDALKDYGIFIESTSNGLINAKAENRYASRFTNPDDNNQEELPFINNTHQKVSLDDPMEDYYLQDKTETKKKKKKPSLTSTTLTSSSLLSAFSPSTFPTYQAQAQSNEEIEFEPRVNHQIPNHVANTDNQNFILRSKGTKLFSKTLPLFIVILGIFFYSL